MMRIMRLWQLDVYCGIEPRIFIWEISISVAELEIVMPVGVLIEFWRNKQRIVYRPEDRAFTGGIWAYEQIHLFVERETNGLERWRVPDK